jgi:spermidine/putrescine transport system ATP-binding protein
VQATASDSPPSPGQEALFAIRPEKMRLAVSEEDLGLHGTIQEVIYIGTDTRYIVSVEAQPPVAVRVQNGCGIAPQEYRRGEAVQLFWLPEDAHLLAD